MFFCRGKGSAYPEPPTEASGSCLDLETPKPDSPKIRLPLKSWPEYFGPHHRQELVVEPQGTAQGLRFIACHAGPGHFQNHTSQFLCAFRAAPRVSSNIQLDFRLDPFPPLPFFFLKRGIPPFSFNPISLSLRAAKKAEPGSHQTAVYFLGVDQQPHRNTWCPGPPPASGRL